MHYIVMAKGSEVYFVTGEGKEELRQKVQDKLKNGFSGYETTSNNIEELMENAREAEPCQDCGINSLMYYKWYDERGIPAGRAYKCITDKCGVHERREIGGVL